MFDFTTFNLSKCDISCKKLFKIQDQICLIWVFLGQNSEKLLYCDILHQHPQIFRNAKFCPKLKIVKFGTKIALIGYFGLELQEPNVVFEISILEFVNMQHFIQKHLGPKIPYLGIFGLQFNKNYYQIFNQYSRICETIKIHLQKRKKLNLGPKMLYWFFGLKCSKTVVIFVINAHQFA